MDVLVRGAGVAGLALARELLQRGAKVTLVDLRPDWSGSASWLAGGMLAPWCERENAEEPVLRDGKGAIDWWDQAVPGLVQRNGTLVVAPARDTGELDRFARRTGGYRFLDRNEVAAVEPDLAGRFAKGLLFEGEAHLDPRAALKRLQEKLVADGVDFHVGGDRIDKSPDVTADCTGMAANDADLRPVRGEMLVLHSPEVHLSRPVRLLHPRFPVYVVPRGNHHFMVGATMIESGDEGPVTVRSTMELLNAAYSLHPGFAEARIVETGAALKLIINGETRDVESATLDLLLVELEYEHGFLATARNGELILADAIKASGTEILTVSLRRESAGNGAGGKFWELIRDLGMRVLPNTAGCHTVREAVTTAQMARELFGTDWIKLEVIGHHDSLQPDVFGLVEAAQILTEDGFKVFPYTTEDVVVGERLLEAGCQLDPFYLIVDSSEWLRRLVPLGVKLVQLRIKDQPENVLRAEITASKKICAGHGCQLIVNDYWQIAIDEGCDFIHLGQEDLADADINAIRKAGLKLGVSTHDGEELETALSIAPEYVALGPVYPTILKKMKWAPQGVEKIARWKKQIGGLPLVAIGGLNPDRLPGVFENGADSAAVVTDITRNVDPEARTREWIDRTQAWR
eukprot:g1472.t1